MSPRQHAVAVWLVTVFVIAIAAAGWAISYSNQVEVMLRHHFSLWAAWVWPATADAGALAVMLLLAIGQVRSGWPTVLAWIVFAACYGVTLGANLLADPGDPLGAAAHTWPAVLAMALVFVIAHGRPDGEPGRVRETDTATRRPEDAQEPPDGSSKRTAVRVATADVEAATARLRAAGQPVTGSALAAELGISERTVRRRLRALRGGRAGTVDGNQEIERGDAP